MKTKTKIKPKLAPPFICAGCSTEKVPDGTPQNAPFIWTDARTNKPSAYCYDCDTLLLNDDPLPKEKQ